MVRKKYSKRVQRIIALRNLLDKDRSEYTNEDRKLVRSCIEKHVGTQWATEGYEGIDE